MSIVVQAVQSQEIQQVICLAQHSSRAPWLVVAVAVGLVIGSGGAAAQQIDSENLHRVGDEYGSLVCDEWPPGKPSSYRWRIGWHGDLTEKEQEVVDELTPLLHDVYLLIAEAGCDGRVEGGFRLGERAIPLNPVHAGNRCDAGRVDRGDRKDAVAGRRRRSERVEIDGSFASKDRCHRSATSVFSADELPASHCQRTKISNPRYRAEIPRGKIPVMDFPKVKSLGHAIRRLLSRLPMLGSAVGLTVGHDALSNFAFNLNWANVDPAKFLYAGTRGISRGISEAHLVWQTIPESLRAAGPEAGRETSSGVRLESHCPVQCWREQ